MKISYAVNHPNAMTVASGQTVRIEGRRGRIVHCLGGHIWLTQHGVIDDYFLPGGTSYRSGGDGLMLVNSCDVLSVIRVRDHASKAGIDVGPVRIEALEQLEQGARGARASALAMMVDGVQAALARAWERCVRVLSTACRPSG